MNIIEKIDRLTTEAVGKHSEKDGAEYKAFFQKMLKQHGASSVADLSKDEKDKFFKAVDKKWKADHE